MSKPIPVKLDKPLLERIVALSAKIGEAQSTVMRMAMRIGLDSLEKSFEAGPADLIKIVSSLRSERGEPAEANKAQTANPSSSTDPMQVVLGIMKKHYGKKGPDAPPGESK